MNWQLEVFEELAWCETVKNGDNRERIRSHSDLVRYIVDGLVWRVLGAVAFRVLSRNYFKPPGLSSQLASVQHVVNVARELSDAGLVTLITDLSHAGQSGDIVASSDGRLLLVECKDRDAPSGEQLGGRLARQIDSMLDAAEYLSGGYGAYLDEDGQPWLTLAPTVDSLHSFEVLARSLENARRGGESMQVVEEGDLFLTSRGAPSSGPLMQAAIQNLPTGALLVIGGPHRLVTEPPHHQCPISAWPLSIENRSDLMRQELVSVHLVDVTPFTVIDDGRIRIQYVQRSQSFSCSFEDRTAEFGGRFVDDVVLGCELRSSAVRTFHDRISEVLIEGRVRVGSQMPVWVAVAYRDHMLVPLPPA